MNTNIDSVDMVELCRQLAETETEIKTLKRILRATWTRPMAGEQRALCKHKEKATLLYIVLALGRGRYHLRAPMRRGLSPGVDWNQERYHRELADRAIDRFGLSAGPIGDER